MRRELISGMFCLCVLSFVARGDEPLAAKLDQAIWQSGPYQGALAVKSIQIENQPATEIGASGLVLSTKSPIDRDVELVIRFRVVPPAGAGSGLTVTAAQKAPGESVANPLAVQLHVYPSPEPESMMWSLGAMPGDKSGLVGNLYNRTLPQNRLLMPEITRQRLEQDYAAQPPLTARTLTFRYQLWKHTARSWLEGCLMRESAHPEIDSHGFLRINLWHGTQLLEASLRELKPVDPRFETVNLDFDLNSNQKPAVSLPGPPGTTAAVDGVPFTLPQPNTLGKTHLDLSPSWLAAGLMEGSFDPAYGDVARWRGAFDRDPARLRFRIPNGQYTKLHLLAVATGEPDTTNTVSIQFYRDHAGHPVSFSGTVPAGGLKHVTIPLEPNGPVAFHNQAYLEFELTKELQIYRAFPDPNYYSMHMGGLPSGAQIYGITLERPTIEAEFKPDQVGHIWTAPAQPSYTVALKNTTSAEQTARLELMTKSYDGIEQTTQQHDIKLAAGQAQDVKLPITLKRYGHHDVTLKIHSGGEIRTQTRSLSFLHPDTRERGNWAEGKGPIFGMWDWNGGHITMGGLDRLKVLGQQGMESSMGFFHHLPDEEKKYLESIGAKSFFLGYQVSMGPHSLGGMAWDPTKPAEMQAAYLKWLKEQPNTIPSAINEPELSLFFAEPILGPISYMSLPEYYGEPEYVMTADEKANFKRLYDQFMLAGQVIKKEWPKSKLLLPWGIPSFPIAFLRESPEASELMDGPAIDLVLFERMPEMQCHQVTVASTMWQTRQEWLKRSKKPWPKLSTIEGPGTSPARPGAVTAQQEADHTTRVVLILMAYNTDRFLGWPTATHCAGGWGEQHYGSGMLEPLPLANPRPVYSTYATMTRQLNRRNFTKIIQTPSTSVFCLQFQHYQTKELLHVFWTLRGERPVTIDVAGGDKVEIFDAMDNSSTPVISNGKTTFTIGTSPVYVHGLKSDVKVVLGEPKHDDAKVGEHAVALGQLGDGSWTLSADRDQDYEDVHPEFIRKFPAKFTSKIEPGPQGQGKALSVHLEQPEKERKTMPFYTTVVPPQPVMIPGKASHLGLWVKAASDWGRVVYCLKDAKGERWLSVGKKGEWNVDDIHNWSAFNYDGWRYLTFEMPGNQPYDLYRDAGTSFWGNYGGDMIVDLPLTLEKVIVERRTHVIHATEQWPAAKDDVALGGLYAEYAKPADKTDEVVRQSKLRMPLPPTPPNLQNPIQKLAEAGTATGPKITKVNPPEREYDGRRCHVHFAKVENAKYDVWVSTYADGRGAIPLAKDWAEPGQLLTGLSPNVDLYLFVVEKDAAGKSSKPGPAYKINLKDMFAMK